MYLDYYILENLLINYIIINCTTYITKIYTLKKNLSKYVEL